MATRGLAVSKDQSREFMACFPDIVRDLTETGKHIDVPEASKWLAKVRLTDRYTVRQRIATRTDPEYHFLRANNARSFVYDDFN